MNYPYYNQFQNSNNFQPLQMPIQMANQLVSNSNQLLRVNGLEGAKAYQMPPNSTVALFDANDDVFYVKNSDSGGFSSVKAYTFALMEEKSVNKSNITTEDYVTRAEFEELKEMIKDGKQFVSKSKSKQSNADDSAI